LKQKKRLGELVFIRGITLEWEPNHPSRSCGNKETDLRKCKTTAGDKRGKEGERSIPQEEKFRYREMSPSRGALYIAAGAYGVQHQTKRLKLVRCDGRILAVEIPEIEEI